MGLRAELQVVSSEKDVPERTDFDRCLDICFSSSLAQTVLIRIVDSVESANLNLQYRHKKGPTNILSFPFEAPQEIPNEHLGDLVICAPLVSREALQQGKPVLHHWIHLLVHGVLHLQGFNHIEAEEAREMELLEMKLLARLGIPDPYSVE